ncbi:Gamma-GCS-GS [Mannheimia haemolytica]|uniref:Gamma-GCS-GS n=1 Tax=Mannheimia haemolytica TaxID=75985 RepID=A0A378MTT9_MANHA|nr:Gamma-GCS-GS [Mannheimia haemolytica]
MAQTYKAQAFERFLCVIAFDNMELSTQALFFDLIQQGIEVEVLDENDQFLALKIWRSFGICEKRNMTSRDQYISPLIMENKVVTKKVLAKAGF